MMTKQLLMEVEHGHPQANSFLKAKTNSDKII